MQIRNDTSWLGDYHIQSPGKVWLEKKEGTMGQVTAEQVKWNFVAKE